MKSWGNFLKVIFAILGIAFIFFNVQLYNLFEQQKSALSSMRDKLDAESEFNSNKFKYQEDRIEKTSKDLAEAQQQIKDQKDEFDDQKDALSAQKEALLQEVQKREEIANESKGIQKSVIDVKAEADAIKQEMKDWQKDYVSVLAQLEKGVNTIQDQIKSLNDNVDALNISGLNQKISDLQVEVSKIDHPVASDTSVTAATVPEKKIERFEIKS